MYIRIINNKGYHGVRGAFGKKEKLNGLNNRLNIFTAFFATLTHDNVCEF